MSTTEINEIACLTDLLQLLEERGDSECVLAFEGRELRPHSCREIAEAARRLAGGLRKLGIEQGDRVALVSTNRPRAIAACLGVIASGAIIVPIDVQLEREILGGVLADCEARLILTSSEEIERIEHLDYQAELGNFLLDVDEGDSGWDRLQSDGDAPLAAPEPDAIATLFYTSGTTGPPKGVPLTHRNLAVQLRTVAAANVVREGDRVLLPLPLHHVYPFVIGMLCPLMLGLPILLPRSLTGPDILHALQRGEVTVVIGVPRLYAALYDALHSRAGKAAGTAGERLFKGAIGLGIWLRRSLGVRASGTLFTPLHRRIAPKLRVLASGGSPLDPDLGRRLEGLGWSVAIGYGLTETSPLLTITPPGAGHLDSVGHAIEDVELRIDTDEPAQSGADDEDDGDAQVGEVLARGPSIFGGYWKRDEKTRESFTEDGWFRTGDLGYLDSEGRLHITGRASTLIVTEQGENVQPDEVEESYAEAEEIREIGVLEQQGRLVAVIVPERRRQAEGQETDAMIRDALRRRSQQLPSYQQIGDFVLTRKPLPRTRLGKIRRQALQELYEELDRADGDTAESEGPIPIQEMAPEDQSLMEQPQARRVWDWLAERFHDEPLTLDSSPEVDLGIDSMEWMNLTLEIAQRTGVELNDEAIGRIETIRQLLQEVTRGAGEQGDISQPLEDPLKVLDEKQKQLLQPQGRFGTAIAGSGYEVNRFVMRRYFHLSVEGDHHLPRSGPLVIVANHASRLDPSVIAASLTREMHAQTYWAAWVGATHRNAIVRWLSRYAQTLPIDPQKGILASLAFGAAVLDRGKVLVWFPEGQRSTDGRLQPFKPGLGLLLKRYPVPVVPAHISGTFEAMPPGRRMPHRLPLGLRYGPPLEPRELEERGEGDEPQQRIMNALRDRIVELARDDM